MKIEMSNGNKIFKLHLHITSRVDIFLYFDYNADEFIWKIGPEFINMDDLYSLSLSLINMGIIIDVDKLLSVKARCNCEECNDNKNCKEKEAK